LTNATSCTDSVCPSGKIATKTAAISNIDGCSNSAAGTFSVGLNPTSCRDSVYPAGNIVTKTADLTYVVG